MSASHNADLKTVYAKLQEAYLLFGGDKRLQSLVGINTAAQEWQQAIEESQKIPLPASSSAQIMGQISDGVPVPVPAEIPDEDESFVAGDYFPPKDTVYSVVTKTARLFLKMDDDKAYVFAAIAELAKALQNRGLPEIADNLDKIRQKWEPVLAGDPMDAAHRLAIREEVLDACKPATAVRNPTRRNTAELRAKASNYKYKDQTLPDQAVVKQLTHIFKDAPLLSDPAPTKKRGHQTEVSAGPAASAKKEKVKSPV